MDGLEPKKRQVEDHALLAERQFAKNRRPLAGLPLPPGPRSVTSVANSDSPRLRQRKGNMHCIQSLRSTGEMHSHALAGQRPGATVMARATAVAVSEVAPVPARSDLLATRRSLLAISIASGEASTSKINNARTVAIAAAPAPAIASIPRNPASFLRPLTKESPMKARLALLAAVLAALPLAQKHLP
jgi:hypothetical protein